MSRDKQIEESNSCCNSCIHRFVCLQCDDNTLVCSQYKNKRNYRKASDVAKEIFDALHKEIVDAIKNNQAVRDERAMKYNVNPFEDIICVNCTAKNHALDGIDCFIASLRKKYENEEAK